MKKNIYILRSFHLYLDSYSQLFVLVTKSHKAYRKIIVYNYLNYLNNYFPAAVKDLIILYISNYVNCTAQ